MEYEVIMNAIGTCGFPIVMCVLLFFYNSKTIKELGEVINELKSESQKTRDLIETLLKFLQGDEK